MFREQPSCRDISLTPDPRRANTRISTFCSWLSIDGPQKADILARMGQFYFDEVGQFSIGANTHAVIGLRRLLKSDPQSISLVRLLEELIATPSAFPRSYYVGLYQGSLAEEFADRDFDKFARPGAPHIDGDLVAADLGRFVAACARCEEFADRRVAHRDRREPRQPPTYKEVDDCIGLADDLYVKYHLLFTANAMDSLLPTWQYDWQAIFEVPWIRAREDGDA